MRVSTHIDDSHRNRPAELGGPDIKTIYADTESGSLEGRTLPVEPVGNLVVDAIRRNALYIITHRETEAFVERRFERIKQAIGQAL
jgi:hypothetical protein